MKLDADFLASLLQMRLQDLVPLANIQQMTKATHTHTHKDTVIQYNNVIVLYSVAKGGGLSGVYIEHWISP